MWRILWLLLSLGLSGCIMSDPPQILSEGLVTDVDYRGRYLNLWNREMLSIEPETDGQYRIVGKGWVNRAVVIDTPDGRVAILHGEAVGGATYFALSKTDAGLEARPLDLKLDDVGIRQALLGHGVEARQEGRHVHFVQPLTTTTLKALFSDVRFASAISTWESSPGRELVFRLQRQ